MEIRDLKITFETAKRWYNGNNEELKKLSLQVYPEIKKKELPNSWEDLGSVVGWYVDANLLVANKIDTYTSDLSRNVFSTKEEAEASIALAQLTQLMKVYNDGWKPDWTDENQAKYCIEKWGGTDVIISINYQSMRLFAFEDFWQAQKFMKNFEDLIIKAQPLF